MPFLGVWLDAPESVLSARAEQRRLDVSDADADVIRRQLVQDTGSITWHRIDASAAPHEVVQDALAVLREHLEPGMIRLESNAT